MLFFSLPLEADYAEKRIFFYKDRDEEIYRNGRDDFIKFVQILFLIPHLYPY